MAEYDEDILPNLQSQYGKGFIEWSKLKKATDSSAFFRDAVFIVTDLTSPYIGRRFQLPSIIYSGVPTADLEEANKLLAQDNTTVTPSAQQEPQIARTPEKWQMINNPASLMIQSPSREIVDKKTKEPVTVRTPEEWQMIHHPESLMVITPLGKKGKTPSINPPKYSMINLQSVALAPTRARQVRQRGVPSSLSLTPNFSSQQAAFSLFGQKQRTVRKRGRLL